MEVFDNLARKTRQYLREKGYMQTIPWQDVMELDSVLDTHPAYKAKIVADLEKWQKTDVGQRQIKALKEEQVQSTNDFKNTKIGTPNLSNPDDVSHWQEDLTSVLHRRKEAGKLLLYVSRAEQGKQTTFDKYVGGGQYLDSHHVLAVNPVSFANPQTHLPKTEDNHKKFIAPTFLDVITHETTHAIDFLKNKRLPPNSSERIKFRECLEERAVKTENDLQHELGVSHRHAYFDPELSLERTYAPNAKGTPKAIEELAEKYADLMLNDVVGCKLESIDNSEQLRIGMQQLRSEALNQARITIKKRISTK